MQLPPLTPDQQVKPRHFELRLSLLFAAIFAPMGVHLPYFPLWLEARGFDAAQIGIILAAPMFLRVATTPFITAMADRAGDRANVLIVLCLLSVLISCGYLLPASYVVILAVSVVLAVVWTPQSPLSDSLALSGVRRFGSTYSEMRIWGSVAFLAGNFGGGFLLAAIGIDALPAAITAGMLVALLAAAIAPRLGRPRRASPLSATDMQDSAPKLLDRHFLLAVTGAGLIIGSHGFLYGFVSIYWQSLGIGEATVGLLWAWAVVAEIAVFLVFKRLFARHPATVILTIAGVAAILRWLAFPFMEPWGVAGFFAAQILHAFSTGLILIGVQVLIAERVSEERTGTAQGVAFFSNGVSMAAVTLLSGPLYEKAGAGGFFIMAIIAAAGLCLVRRAARSAP